MILQAFFEKIIKYFFVNAQHSNMCLVFVAVLLGVF